MKESNGSSAFYATTVSALLGCIFLICISSPEGLRNLVIFQREDLCLINTEVCNGLYGFFLDLLGHPAEWSFQLSATSEYEEFVEGFPTSISRLFPDSDWILRWSYKSYFIALVVAGRLGQILTCSILTLPVLFVALRLAALSVKIKRLDFKSEQPFVMRYKWLLTLGASVGLIAICLLPIRIRSELMLVLVGTLLLFFGWLLSTIWQTNQP